MINPSDRSTVYAGLIREMAQPDPEDDFTCPWCGELYPYCDCPSAPSSEVLEQAGQPECRDSGQP